jgi:hypothetical protein
MTSPDPGARPLFRVLAGVLALLGAVGIYANVAVVGRDGIWTTVGFGAFTLFMGFVALRGRAKGGK